MNKPQYKLRKALEMNDSNEGEMSKIGAGGEVDLSRVKPYLLISKLQLRGKSGDKSSSK